MYDHIAHLFPEVEAERERLNRFGVAADEFPQECAQCGESAFFLDVLRKEHVCEKHLPAYSRRHFAPMVRHLKACWERDGRSLRRHLLEWEDKRRAKGAQP